MTGINVHRPYFRERTLPKPAYQALRPTEHSKLVQRVENSKKEIADLKVQIAEKDRLISLLTAEVAQLRSQLNETVPAMAQQIATLEDTVAQKTYALKAGGFVPPTL